MRYSFFSAILCAIILHNSLAIAQDTKPTGFSIGTKHAGIGFGEFYDYSGLRLNYENTDSSTINGIDFTLAGLMRYSHQSIVNGLSLALTNTYNARTNGVSAAFVDMTDTVNGLSVGILAAGATSRNGLILSAIAAGAYRLNGLVIAPLTGGSRLNGAAIGALTVFTEATGCLVGLANFHLGSDTSQFLHGAEIGAYNSTRHLRGIQIGLINNTTELHGIQLGLLNKADNAYFKYFPFVNINL